MIAGNANTWTAALLIGTLIGASCGLIEDDEEESVSIDSAEIQKPAGGAVTVAQPAAQDLKNVTVTQVSEGVRSGVTEGVRGSTADATQSIVTGGGGGGSSAVSNLTSQGVRGVVQIPAGVLGAPRRGPKRSALVRVGSGKKVKLVKVGDDGNPVAATLAVAETDLNGEFVIVHEELTRLSASFMVVYGSSADGTLMRATVTNVEITVDPVSEVTVRVAVAKGVPLSSVSPQRMEEMVQSVRSVVASVEIVDISSIDAVADAMEETAVAAPEVDSISKTAMTEDLKGISVSPQLMRVVPEGGSGSTGGTFSASTEPAGTTVIWRVVSGLGTIDSSGVFWADYSAVGGAVATVSACLETDPTICDTAEVEYVSATDIVFVIDTTGSMYGQIEGVKNSVVDFANYVERDVGVNVNLGAVTFGDFVATTDPTDPRAVEDWGIRPIFSPSGDFVAFQDFVGALEATGGGDGPENALDAIMYAYNDMTYRSGAHRIFILIIDIMVHYKGDGGGWTNPETGLFEEFAHYTLSEVTEELCGSVPVHAVSPDWGGDEENPKVLAEGTGGTWIVMPVDGNIDLTTLPLQNIVLGEGCRAVL